MRNCGEGAFIPGTRRNGGMDRGVANAGQWEPRQQRPDEIYGRGEPQDTADS